MNITCGGGDFGFAAAATGADESSVAGAGCTANPADDEEGTVGCAETS